MPLLERQALPRPAFGCGAGEHGADGSIAHAVASFVARERPARQRTKAHQQRYVPQFAPIVGRTKQTPYRHRLTGGSVQQGLSVAGDVRDSSPFCGATDKRYSLDLFNFHNLFAWVLSEQESHRTTRWQTSSAL